MKNCIFSKKTLLMIFLSMMVLPLMARTGFGHSEGTDGMRIDFNRFDLDLNVTDLMPGEDQLALQKAEAFFPEPYCDIIGFDTSVEPITRVVFSDIDNSTSPEVDMSPKLEDFTSVIGTVIRGATYSFAGEGNTNGNWPNTFTVFIDWDQDNEFDNDDERYEIGVLTNSTGEDGQQVVSNIYVPFDAIEGQTRMRVIKRLGEISYAVSGCESGSNFGQAEDYTVNVTQGVFPEPYCEVSGITQVEPITKVSFAGIVNPSENSSTAPAHEDFTSIQFDIETAGVYEFKAEGNTNGNFTDYITLFIDWNLDGEFDNETERYEIGTIQNSTGDDGVQASEFIEVPVDALEGVTRLRVIKSRDNFAADACTSGANGQAEDYMADVDLGMYYSCEQTYFGMPDQGQNFSEGNIGANDFVVEPNSQFELTGLTIYMIVVDIMGSDEPTGFHVQFFEDNNGEVGESIGQVYDFDTSNMIVTPNGMYLGYFPYYIVTLPFDNVEFENYTGETKHYWAAITSDLATGDKPTNWLSYNISPGSASYPMFEYQEGSGWGPFVDGVKEGMMIVDGVCGVLMGTGETFVSDFDYYPNPVSEVLHIKSGKEIKSVEIFSLTGQQIKTLTNPSNDNIDLRQLSPGIYFFRLILDGGQIETFKIIKK